MSNSNLPKFGLCLFPISIFWLCLFQNPSYYEFFICHRVEFFMSISKGLIPNSTLCLIPKVLLQCLVFEPSMSNSKGLPTPIRLRLPENSNLLHNDGNGYILWDFFFEFFSNFFFGFFEIFLKFFLKFLEFFYKILKFLKFLNF